MTFILIGLLSVLAYLIYNSVSGDNSSLDDVIALAQGKLSASQIAGYASAAGFTGDALNTAVAIALAESSGNPSAYNPETAAGTPQGIGSYGLWQIYLYKHPEFANLNLNDPQTNANAAYQIYSNNGSNFSAWSTYNSGAYLAYVPQASSAEA